jgi:hypothetical protein
LAAERFEEALGVCQAVRRTPPESRALRALWAAFEQDFAEALLERSRAAQAAAEPALAARWLGLLERLDPGLAQRAERSWVRRLAAAAAAAPQGSASGAAGRGDLKAPSGLRGPASNAAQPPHGGRRDPGSGPIPRPDRRVTPKASPWSAELPDEASAPGPPARLARLLADDLGEWLLVAAQRLWFRGAEQEQALPVDLPGLEPGQELCLLRGSRAGFLAFERRSSNAPWTALGSLEPGLALSLGTAARPSLRLLPRWLSEAVEPPCLALSFERGVAAGEAQGLIWLSGELCFGASAGNLLRASSLASAHRFQFDGDSLSLCGPGPIRRLGPPGQPPEDRLQELFRCPFPPPQRFEFELGGGRPPLWMRLEPLEARP